MFDKNVPDYIYFSSFKIMFAISLFGLLVFFILYMFEVLKDSNDCLTGGLLSLDCSNETKYQLVIDYKWTSDNNGTTTPSDASFSTGIGSTFASETDSFWKFNELASNGLNSLITNNSIASIESEIREKGQTPFEISHTTTGLTRITKEFNVKGDDIYLSFVSALNNSPDWFVGVSGLKLCDDGTWINRLSVPLVPLDAGFNSASNFTDPLSVESINVDLLSSSTYLTEFKSYPIGSAMLIRMSL
jgi:hypothetical protein